ncbi:uncharacterized protein LOC128315651 [Acinonyx jubatus]|uniref:Uncharacterized protein LOC128315651 n=1 Tax=Acinonyx jubatus TaxID=32536 RepID=A0ABM3Q4N4_ACIJB|nr:uncharacterized protein LOC128315651 [Acinonyx jubatus]
MRAGPPLPGQPSSALRVRGGRREGWEPPGRPSAAERGRAGVKQGAGAGRGGSGGRERRESESGGGGGGGGTGAKEHPVPVAGCAPGEEVVRGGGKLSGEARGGERLGLRPPPGPPPLGAPISVLSPRFFLSPGFRWSNELQRGPRIWFLGLDVADAERAALKSFWPDR